MIIRYNRRLAFTHEHPMPRNNLALLAYDNCLASSITLPSEMLNAANDACSALHRNQPAAQYFEPKIYGRKKRISCAGNISLTTTAHPKSLRSPTLVILPAIWRNPTSVIHREQYLLPLLRQCTEAGPRICAV